MIFFSPARRTCGTTHFIRPCTILHATGFGLPPNFEDWYIHKYSVFNGKKFEIRDVFNILNFLLIGFYISIYL